MKRVREAPVRERVFRLWPHLPAEMQGEVAARLDTYSRQALAMTCKAAYSQWGHAVHARWGINPADMGEHAHETYIQWEWNRRTVVPNMMHESQAKDLCKRLLVGMVRRPDPELFFKYTIAFERCFPTVYDADEPRRTLCEVLLGASVPPLVPTAMHRQPKYFHPDPLAWVAGDMHALLDGKGRPAPDPAMVPVWRGLSKRSDFGWYINLMAVALGEHMVDFLRAAADLDLVFASYWKCARPNYKIVAFWLCVRDDPILVRRWDCLHSTTYHLHVLESLLEMWPELSPPDSRSSLCYYICRSMCNLLVPHPPIPTALKASLAHVLERLAELDPLFKYVRIVLVTE